MDGFHTAPFIVVRPAAHLSLSGEAAHIVLRLVLKII